MKAYKKQIDNAKVDQNKQEKTVDAPATAPKEFGADRDARVNFMRNLVADARVRM